jgi:uncharacterized cupredoxin-like copper-binding protein
MVLGVAVLVLPLSIFVIGCSSDDGDSDSAPAGSPAPAGTIPAAAATQVTGPAGEVEAAMRAAIDAYNQKNLPVFLSYWTDDGLKAEFDATKAELQAAGPEFFEGPPLSLKSISNTSVSGTNATSEVELAFGLGVERTKYDFVREGNTWKIDGGEDLKAAIPSGTTAVDVTLDEFSFAFDRSKLAGGNVAFNLKNEGEQPHELVLIKSPASFGLNQLLAMDPNAEPPPGVEFLAGAGPIDPGKDGRLVFTEKLAGHYLMVCFLPDITQGEDGPPHFTKGMAVEFTAP